MRSGLMWLRRDLRCHDNHALHQALQQVDRVYCVFCFDRAILDQLQDRRDRRVDFIRQSLVEMDEEMRERGGGLIVRHGFATEEIPRLAAELGVCAVFANHDYEPDSIARDQSVADRLQQDGRSLQTFKDQVIFEKNEVLNKSGGPFKVYTPYRNAWRSRLEDENLAPFDDDQHSGKLAPAPDTLNSARWSLEDLGFEATDLQIPAGSKAGRQTLDAFLTRIQNYPDSRDFPAVAGVSRLSTHLRFGTLSIREACREALDHGSAGADKWVDQLIWREFYNMVLLHFPHTVDHAFQEVYRDLPWENDEAAFRRWCTGSTGYPIVDAGMRELNSTGYMHNRLRMIVASFLTKDLRIHWRWGERYFAQKLLDFDLSQNLGGWQWSAGIGTDAQPYFRIFNPVEQSKRFDEQGTYIRRYVPELTGYPDKMIHAPWKSGVEDQQAAGCMIGSDYPAPMIDHAIARKKTIEMFKQTRQAAA